MPEDNNADEVVCDGSKENKQENDGVQQLADEKKADIFVVSGGINRRLADWLLEFFDRFENTRPNVVVFLCTFGGDPNAAYVIASTFKRIYDEFTVYISGYCKSAGTIITLGADEIFMGSKGELGPLDVQVLKEDTLMSRTSGLDSTKSIGVLQSEAFDLFGQIFFSLIDVSDGRFSTRTAAKIATDLVGGLLSPIAAQVDPLKLAENHRELAIAQKYGEQLGADTDSIRKLIYDYPSHGHVIDINEARRIFGNRAKPFRKLDMQVEKEIQGVMEGYTGEESIRWPHESGIVMPFNLQGVEVRTEPESHEETPQAGNGEERNEEQVGDSSELAAENAAK